GNGVEQAEHGDAVDAEQEGLIDVKPPGVQVAGGERDEGAEQRRGVAGAGEPVFMQVTVLRAGGGEAVEEVLVLVGVVQRRLAVGGGEGGGPDDEQEERPCGAARDFGEAGHGIPGSNERRRTRRSRSVRPAGSLIQSRRATSGNQNRGTASSVTGY